ncbi:MAG: hypothetical protein ACYC27_11855 [Armatimonadota bacterium]
MLDLPYKLMSGVCHGYDPSSKIREVDRRSSEGKDTTIYISIYHNQLQGRERTPIRSAYHQVIQNNGVSALPGGLDFAEQSASVPYAYYTINN